MLISQAFSLPAAVGFGANIFTVPAASWVAPAGVSGQVQAVRKGWWQHCELVSGRVDLEVCWAQESIAHRLLRAELLEDACKHSH